METRVSQCPGEGTDRCDRCLQIAEDWFASELREGGFDEPTIENYTGDAKLRAPLEEQGGVSALPCLYRQDRARAIGRKAGERLVYDSKAPGEV